LEAHTTSGEVAVLEKKNMDYPVSRIQLDSTLEAGMQNENA
jgi:hypothetical protein